MKMIFLLFMMAQPARASINLKQTFEKAKARMENIQRQEAESEQAIQRKKRLLGTLGPSLSAVGTYTMIDPPPTSGIRAFTLTRQYSSAIRLEQPLLRGGTLASYQMANMDVELQKFLEKSTELELYQLVINAYFSLYQAQRDMEHLNKLKIFSEERVNDLKQRASIGKARKGELSQAQAQLMTAMSQLAEGERVLKERLYQFSFLTGEEAPSVLAIDPLPIVEESEKSLQAKLVVRPDLKALRQRISIAEKGVDVAKGGHWPNLNLTGNYYLTRTGILEDSQWDVIFSLNFPLFQSGTVMAQVRESVEEKRQAELSFKESERSAQRDIATILENVKKQRQQVEHLKTGMQKAEEAYHLSKKDYQYGIVTSLELLQGLNLYIESKRDYDRALAMAYMSYYHLQALSGVTP